MTDLHEKIEWHNAQILLLQHQAVTGIMTHAEARAEIEDLQLSRDRIYANMVRS